MNIINTLLALERPDQLHNITTMLAHTPSITEIFCPKMEEKYYRKLPVHTSPPCEKRYDSLVFFGGTDFIEKYHPQLTHTNIALTLLMRCQLRFHAQLHTTHYLLGPNSWGCIAPQRYALGALHDLLLQPGGLGILASTLSLLREVVWSTRHIGHSLVVHTGEPSLSASRWDQLLQWYEDDPKTNVILLLGSGDPRERAALHNWCSHPHKPCYYFAPGSHVDSTLPMLHSLAACEKMVLRHLEQPHSV